MLSRTSLCDLIQPVIEGLGLELFDVDLPSAKSGVLRVFIMRSVGSDSISGSESVSEEKPDDVKGPERNGVTLDDCAKVSRELSGLEGFEEMLPEGITLEISSPGVNRRLRTERHFQGAVGEHIRIKHTDENNCRLVKKGTLLDFNGGLLKFREDGSEMVTDIPYANIDDARVEFIFQ